MLKKVRETLFECLKVFFIKICLGDATMVFQRANRCHNNNSIRLKTRKAALDVEKFLCAKVSAKACLGYTIVT